MSSIVNLFEKYNHKVISIDKHRKYWNY
jgi:hypothetical protein